MVYTSRYSNPEFLLRDSEPEVLRNSQGPFEIAVGGQTPNGIGLLFHTAHRLGNGLFDTFHKRGHKAPDTKDFRH